MRLPGLAPFPQNVLGNSGQYGSPGSVLACFGKERPGHTQWFLSKETLPVEARVAPDLLAPTPSFRVGNPVLRRS